MNHSVFLQGFGRRSKKKKIFKHYFGTNAKNKPHSYCDFHWFFISPLKLTLFGGRIKVYSTAFSGYSVKELLNMWVELYVYTVSVCLCQLNVNHIDFIVGYLIVHITPIALCSLMQKHPHLKLSLSLKTVLFLDCTELACMTDRFECKIGPKIFNNEWLIIRLTGWRPNALKHQV